MTIDQWDAFRDNFKKLYQSLRDLNSFNVLSRGTLCNDSTPAYYDNQGIHICDYFWDLRTERPYGFASQASTILHEVTHMSVVLKTGDNDNNLPNVGLWTSYTYQRFAENDPWLPMSCLPDEPQIWCQPGKAMVVPTNGCADSLHTTEVVESVCNQLSKCCSSAWDLDCVRMAAQYAMGNSSIGDVCGREAWVQGTLPDTQQKYPRDFNLFVRNTASAFPDVQGPTASGGEFSAAHFKLNWYTRDSMPVGLVSGGNVTLQNGHLISSFYSPNLNTFPYADMTTLGSSVTIVKGGSYRSSSTQPLDFEAAFSRLEAMSEALRWYTDSPQQKTYSTGSGTSKIYLPNVELKYGTLTIISDQQDLNVVTVTPYQIEHATGVVIKVPDKSRLLINVVGDSGVSFKSMQISRPGSMPCNNIIWNFPDAQNIAMAGVGFPGSILAPKSDIEFDWGGMIAGTLVAKAAHPKLSTGFSFEIHWSPPSWPM